MVTDDFSILEQFSEGGSTKIGPLKRDAGGSGGSVSTGDTGGCVPSDGRGAASDGDTGVPDQELQRMSFEMYGCFYLPTSDVKAARQWLIEVADVLAAPASE